MSFLHYYYTPRFVGIEHKQLGLLYWAFVGLALGYTLFAIFQQKNYLEFDSVTTAVNLKLKWPTGILRLSDSAYCAETTAADGSKRPCVMWDKYEVGRYRNDNSFFITTKVKETHEKRVCPLNSAECPIKNIWNKTSSKTYFVNGVDSLVLRISHSFTASHFYEETHNPEYSLTSNEMSGVFVAGRGPIKVLNRFPIGESDGFNVGALLEAAQLSLDAESHEPSNVHGKNLTFRNSGFVIALDLLYHNTICKGSFTEKIWSGCLMGTTRPVYRYRVSATPAPTRFHEIQEDSETGTRVRRSLHGILVQVHQSGKIGRFSISVLLIQIAAGLSFLSLATMIVDNISYYVLVGQKFEYSKYVYYDNGFERRPVPAPQPVQTN